MGLKNVEDRSQRLQEVLKTIGKMKVEDLLKKKGELEKSIMNQGNHYESPSPITRDELRLVIEEIQRRYA